LTRNTHTIIRNIGGEYVRKIVPADPEPTLENMFVDALEEIVLLANDDDVLFIADLTLREYHARSNNDKHKS
jgi:hypothetical protein